MTEKFTLTLILQPATFIMRQEKRHNRIIKMTDDEARMLTGTELDPQKLYMQVEGLKDVLKLAVSGLSQQSLRNLQEALEKVCAGSVEIPGMAEALEIVKEHSSGAPHLQ